MAFLQIKKKNLRPLLTEQPLPEPQPNIKPKNQYYNAN